MPAELHDLLTSRRQSVAASLVERLKGSSAPHYQNVDTEVLRRRIEHLVDAFIAGTSASGTPFIEYIEAISEERIAEGYFLAELQLALNTLQDLAWQAAREGVQGEALADALTQINRTLGEAKDQLACLYVAHEQAVERKAHELERKVSELFKGTDCMCLNED